MISKRKSLLFLRIISDIVFILLSIYYVSIINGLSYPYILKNGWQLIVILLFVWYFSARITGLYEDSHLRSFGSELIILIKNIFVQLIAAVLIMFLSNQIIFSRSFILLYVSFLLLFLLPQKYLVRKALIYLRKRGRNLRHVLVIGAGKTGMDFYEAVKNNVKLGYNIIGFLDDEKKAYLNGEYLGSLKDLKSVLQNNPVDNVIVALPSSAEKKIKEVIKTCELYAKRVKLIPDYFRFFIGKNNLSVLERFPVISFREEKLNKFQWVVIKRAFDILVSLIFMAAVSWWLFPSIALYIKLDSEGPVFFKQERWGKDNKKFFTHKFRTMQHKNGGTDKESNFQQAVKNDPRITRVGRILRTSSLDELPQFWNVLKGDMTIVGPRPHPTPLNIESQDKVELYMFRHVVKPGITGWAQVNGFRGDTKSTDSAMQERIEHDLWYIENWSFWLDMEIIFLTAVRTLKGELKAF